MVTIEEKLDIFAKLVLEQAQNKYNNKLQEIEKQNIDKIESHEQRLQVQKEKIIQELYKKGELERNKLVSKAKLDGKKKILAKQQELVERHIKNLKQMAEDFTEKKGYKSFLEKTLSEIFSHFKNEPAITLFLMEKDIQKYSSLALKKGKEFNFNKEQITILAGASYMIGGVQGIDSDKIFRIDLSMNTMIEQRRKQIGQKLYDVLKEAGGIDE